MSKVLIIGGSRGIGRTILEQQMHRRSCINISRSTPDLDGAYEHYSMDVTQDDLPEIEDINALIYCPGSINLKPLGSLKEEDFRADFEVNVMGAVRAVKKYHRTLKRSKDASIILFSTVAVNQGMAFHASVAAAKGALEGLGKTLAAELAPDVRVNIIAPTLTDTPLASHLLRNEEMRSKMKDRHPLKRIVDPSEIAHLVDFLIGPKAASMTGQVLQVDAGITTIK